ncbi:unnamed protein product, partial [Phaeothamnion confervicola]
FGTRAKPKKTTAVFAARKGLLHLAWGGRNAVPLESIYGVVKGIETAALQRTADAARPGQYFSLLTPTRTVDFEVHNPWLVLLVVRALRLFLGAHYNTLAAPDFFSPLLLRPRGSIGDGAGAAAGATTSPAAAGRRLGGGGMVWTRGDSIARALPKAAPSQNARNEDDEEESDERD